MDISIVFPALNEAHKIGKDLESAAVFFSKSQLEGEVIVVDDGSTDGTAKEAGRVSLSQTMERKVIRLEKNRGKGYAVKTGVLATKGKIILVADSGNCIPLTDALPSMKKIQAGELDVALASRRLKETEIMENRPLKRRLLSWLFHKAAVWVAGLPRWITDSQCGFKLYRGDLGRQLFSKLKTEGFMFELEILLRAQALGCRITEFPVHWTCDLDTRMSPASDAFGVWKELLRVRKNLENLLK
jgi:dolichyl-phosphate beta-glucosyltransferase